MLAFVARRLALSLVVLVAATAVVFLLVSTHGDPLAELKTSASPSAETIELLTKEYHLDRPLAVRYWYWLSDFLRGDWGTSYQSRGPVADIIRAALPNSLMLVGGAFALSVTAALAVGVLGAVRHHTAVDHMLSGLSYFGLSMPVFWFGLVLQLVVVIVPYELWGVRVFYTTGKHATGHEGELLDLLRHLALPTVTLSLAHIAAWSRYQRSSMLDALGADYVRTARAKGVAERGVVVRHALRNAMLPFVTVSALGAAAMVGGAVVTEQVFSWPGMGGVFLRSIRTDDYPVILSWLALVAVAMVVANLLADIAVRLLAPQSARP